jgi:hypothetical protein
MNKWKSLDPTSIKEKLEDYGHMLQYALMRTKNKMKDFET